MGNEALFDEEQLRQDPDAMINLIKSLYNRIHSLEQQLKKPSTLPISKEIYPQIGGSKKGKSGMTWNKKTPDVVFNLYVKECLNCHTVAPTDIQKISYSKRIMEMPKPAQIELQEVHIHEFKCPSCGRITQAADPTLRGTSLGPSFLTFLTIARYHTGSSFENIAQLIEANTGIKPSQTALNRGIAKVCDILVTCTEEITSQVMNSNWVNIDAIDHILIEQKRKKNDGPISARVWVFACQEAAFYNVDLTGNQNVLKSALKYRTTKQEPPIGILNCDTYFMDILHVNQLCWSHLLQDSKELANISFEGRILHDGLVDLNERVREIRTSLLKKKPIQEASEIIIEKALLHMDELIGIKSDSDEIKKLQKKLSKVGKNYLTCLKYPYIPMTNIHAKELLKIVVLHRAHGKKLRSKNAMKQYSTLLTVLTTWNLQKIPLPEKLQEVIHNHIDCSKLID